MTLQNTAVSHPWLMLSMTENDIQKIVDNNPDHERSLKSKHGIQNAIAAYKQVQQESVTSLTIENEMVFQADDRG